MKLSELLRAAGITLTSARDPELAAVRIDSRKVGKGDLFLALKGAHDDGSRYVADAISRGAAAVLSEGNSHPALEGAPEPHPGAEILPCPGLRSQVGDLFNAWYGRPAEGMDTVAVTGTNGKSTITKLTSSILKAAGRKVISLGTISYDIDGESLPSDLTTPGPDQFFGLLRQGADKGCTALSMEVSSHALSQDRVKGVLFSRAIFTNLTRDHMDYHPDFEDYYQAKKRLFTRYLRADGVAILNLDSPQGVRLAKELPCAKLTFSRGAHTLEASAGQAEPANQAGISAGRPPLARPQADLELKSSRLTLSGSEFEIAFKGVPFRFQSKLVGSLNLENLLAAVAFGFSMGFDAGTIGKGIRDVTVLGRAQVFALPSGGFAVVDYAHTPDALERILISLRPLTPGKLACLFGCGGDRDRTKRPIMGKIAVTLADRAFLTSDNPRGENPEAILSEVAAGMPDASKATLIADRREAIRAALATLGRDDCLLIAGKGHEDYQIVGKTKRHFSDQEEILAWAGESGKAGAGRTMESGHGA
ncbi:MAG: UDP-N-acetylmuramoyl-L-alanyl-D-glutamate--2,6-diaminopimelate ligase [Fibrobacteres bacterium]|nr:UDP-N-acetylmuramoyl-L-alanyl-D-glutamate--2,6-diaminopimelate ligase [Fibrobacterota bacterium]